RLCTGFGKGLQGSRSQTQASAPLAPNTLAVVSTAACQLPHPAFDTASGALARSPSSLRLAAQHACPQTATRAGRTAVGLLERALQAGGAQPARPARSGRQYGPKYPHQRGRAAPGGLWRIAERKALPRTCLGDAGGVACRR